MPEPKAERKPYVAIFDDDKTRRLTKSVWSLLSGRDLKLANINTPGELDKVAADAVLILIRVPDADSKNIGIARHIGNNPRVVAQIIAATEDAGPGERIRILAAGFDGIFNLGSMDFPDFQQVLLNRVEKGFTSLENRYTLLENR